MTTNLDDFASFAALDPQDMYGQIEGLPQQLLQAWEHAQDLPLPHLDGIQQVLVSGMGGSAIGADLLSAYAAPLCPVPLTIQRDYDLPAWAAGPHTLVIASSHSGNTEETLSGYQAALAGGCRTLAVTTGGELARRAQAAGEPLWIFEHKGQPRAAVGWSFTLLLAALTRLGLLRDPSAELTDAVQAMRRQQQTLGAQIPVTSNPAKRMAGQLLERWVNVFAAGLLAPVARRWKGQISEIAKAWAQFEFLPEANHNTLAGVVNPEDQLARSMTLFLRCASEHPRNRLRSDLTRQAFLLEGMNTDFIDAQGDTRLAQLWTCLHLGDYTAFYLAMAYGVDPTPVAAIENFKQALKQASS